MGVYPFLKSKAQVVGMDISALIVQNALESHTDLQGTTADIHCLPFNENVFDLIVSNSTLDHFKTQMKLWRACMNSIEYYEWAGN